MNDRVLKKLILEVIQEVLDDDNLGTIKDLYQRYQNGEDLSDEEVKTLFDGFALRHASRRINDDYYYATTKQDREAEDIVVQEISRNGKYSPDEMRKVIDFCVSQELEPGTESGQYDHEDYDDYEDHGDED